MPGLVELLLVALRILTLPLALRTCGVVRLALLLANLRNRLRPMLLAKGDFFLPFLT